MLEQMLQIIIPSKLSQFSKINPDREPYYFDSWDRDKGSDGVVLRYWFWSRDRTKKYKKRVFIRELENLARDACYSGFVTRDDFERLCPQTKSDGSCGFAVMIALLEFYELVQRLGVRKYRVVNIEKLCRILGN